MMDANEAEVRYPRMADEMTLRDYFAGQALAGLCTDHNTTDLSRLVAAAWHAADEMLRQRNK